MTVEVLILPRDLQADRIATRTVVVFDVLRATTSITAALSNGIAEVRVFGDLESTLAAANPFDGPKLTCGERHTVRPDGFDLGNSPGQFDGGRYAGRTAFMSTTNGTKAIVAARSAKTVLCGALVNAAAVAKVLAKIGDDVTLLCSGSDGEPSAEDLLGAGTVLNELSKISSVQTEGDLAIIAAVAANASAGSLQTVLSTTHGGKNIRRVHLDDDIAFAARSNVFDVVGQVFDNPLRVRATIIAV